MSLVFVANHQRSKAPPNQTTIQKLLDENSQFIKTIVDYQSKGNGHEVMHYQQMLHRNLVYLATVADSSQNVQNLLPPVPGQMPLGPGGMPIQQNQMPAGGMVGSNSNPMNYPNNQPMSGPMGMQGLPPNHNPMMSNNMGNNPMGQPMGTNNSMGQNIGPNNMMGQNMGQNNSNLMGQIMGSGNPGGQMISNINNNTRPQMPANDSINPNLVVSENVPNLPMAGLNNNGTIPESTKQAITSSDKNLVDQHTADHNAEKDASRGNNLETYKPLEDKNNSEDAQTSQNLKGPISNLKKKESEATNISRNSSPGVQNSITSDADNPELYKSPNEILQERSSSVPLANETRVKVNASKDADNDKDSELKQFMKEIENKEKSETSHVIIKTETISNNSSEIKSSENSNTSSDPNSNIVPIKVIENSPNSSLNVQVSTNTVVTNENSSSSIVSNTSNINSSNTSNTTNNMNGGYQSQMINNNNNQHQQMGMNNQHPQMMMAQHQGVSGYQNINNYPGGGPQQNMINSGPMHGVQYQGGMGPMNQGPPMRMMHPSMMNQGGGPNQQQMYGYGMMGGQQSGHAMYHQWNQMHSGGMMIGGYGSNQGMLSQHPGHLSMYQSGPGGINPNSMMPQQNSTMLSQNPSMMTQNQMQQQNHSMSQHHPMMSQHNQAMMSQHQMMVQNPMGHHQGSASQQGMMMMQHRHMMAQQQQQQHPGVVPSRSPSLQGGGYNHSGSGGSYPGPPQYGGPGGGGHPSYSLPPGYHPGCHPGGQQVNPYNNYQPGQDQYSQYHGQSRMSSMGGNQMNPGSAGGERNTPNAMNPQMQNQSNLAAMLAPQIQTPNMMLQQQGVGSNESPSGLQSNNKTTGLGGTIIPNPTQTNQSTPGNSQPQTTNSPSGNS